MIFMLITNNSMFIVRPNGFDRFKQQKHKSSNYLCVAKKKTKQEETHN